MSRRNDPLSESEKKFSALVHAVAALYYAAYWKADRECDENALWTAVRDAAGFRPGHSSETLGEPRWR